MAKALPWAAKIKVTWSLEQLLLFFCNKNYFVIFKNYFLGIVLRGHRSLFLH